VGKIAEKAVSRSVFLTTSHCIFSAELTKMHSFRLKVEHEIDKFFVVTVNVCFEIVQFDMNAISSGLLLKRKGTDRSIYSMFVYIEQKGKWE